MSRTKKSPSNGPSARQPSPNPRETSPSPDRPLGPLSVQVPSSERDIVKVNNGSLTELKNACDDALKRYLSRPDLFKQIYMHTDVRLGLGWLSVFTAAGTALYGYKIEFEKSKPVVWAGLILYILLTFLQTLYAYFIEGEVVFVGKRKTFSKRVHRNRTDNTLIHTEPATKSTPPAYQLSLNYVRSTNGGKSLLAKGKTKGKRGYNAFFDEQGVMDQELSNNGLAS
ncbi:microsomal signal peptidase 25 kDa subunit-domain-containing protein [Cyathus striatus]|nr:microsomal signal peptidase 25 kDa subunit-domain-containing protein [Cyathus striatus]